MRVLKDIDAIRDNFSRLTIIPLCMQNTLIETINLIAMRVCGHDSLILENGQQISSNQEIIEVGLNKLERYTEMEEIPMEKVKKCLDFCYSKLCIQDWVSMQERLQELYKNLIVFDIGEFSALINKANYTVDLVKNQDIILLLGATGCGKSTTVQYLAGSVMAETREIVGYKKGQEKCQNGRLIKTEITIPHISASKIYNEALKKVKTSYRAKSETSYMVSVPIKPQDIMPYGSLRQNIVLCDTPGFDDTRSIEIDVANGVSFVRAVKLCNSVRPLFLIDKEGIGARCEGLKYTMRIITELIPKIRFYIDYFFFAFTKYQDYEVDDISGILKKLENDLSPEEKMEEFSIYLLNEMIARIEKEGPLLITPLDNKPGVSLKRIMASKPISHPSEAFQFFVSDKAQSHIREQIRRHQISISSALKRFDYDLVAYKLRELRELSHILRQPFIE